MLLLNNEEEKYSSLNVQDEELDISITQEELNLKEVLKFLQFFMEVEVYIILDLEVSDNFNALEST